MNQTVRFDYDALGRRIAKHHSFGTVHFIWEGLRLLQERHRDRITTQVYEPGSYAPLARVDSSVPLPVFELPSDKGKPPPQEPAKTKIYWFHNNASGAPEEVTDRDGRLQWRARYTVWGNLALEEHPAAQVDHSSPKFESQKLRLQGQYTDDQSFYSATSIAPSPKNLP